MVEGLQTMLKGSTLDQVAIDLYQTNSSAPIEV